MEDARRQNFIWLGWYICSQWNRSTKRKNVVKRLTLDSSVIIASLLKKEPRHREALGIWNTMNRLWIAGDWSETRITQHWSYLFCDFRWQIGGGSGWSCSQNGCPWDGRFVDSGCQRIWDRTRKFRRRNDVEIKNHLKNPFWFFLLPLKVKTALPFYKG